MAKHSLYSCSGLTVSVTDRLLVDSLELVANPGLFLALLGQNGSGKTLTLHTLAGLRPPDSGSVCLAGHPLHEHPRQQFARRVALLPQHTEDIFPATVLETVLIGRHPHIGRFQWESASDVDIAMRSLGRMGIDDLCQRDVTTLSGGERRRLAIAQVLTQDPEVYLLDEAINHLDPHHQLAVLQAFREIADSGCVVIASLHDVNLAARFADECLLLYGDGRWEHGPANTVLDENRLSEIYSIPMSSVDWQNLKLFVPGDARWATPRN